MAATVGLTGAADAAVSAERVYHTIDRDAPVDVVRYGGGGHSINIGNDACVLPWYWQGPFNVVTGGEEGSYAACNGDSGTTAQGINVLNDACVLPWYWQGPINFITVDEKGRYAACNGQPDRWICLGREGPPPPSHPPVAASCALVTPCDHNE